MGGNNCQGSDMNMDELKEMLWTIDDAEFTSHLTNSGALERLPLQDRWNLANSAAFRGHGQAVDLLLASIPDDIAPESLSEHTSTTPLVDPLGEVLDVPSQFHSVTRLP